MQLSVLESRLLHALPEEYHDKIQKQFARFETGTSRVSDKHDKIGQATLTKREIERATTTNQNGDYGYTIIELQCIKGAALKYGIDDWLSYVDPEITYEENIGILKEKGNPTNKQISAQRKSKQRWK